MSSSTPRRTSTRPWHKDSNKSAVQEEINNPLIPEEYMDVGQQRLVAISVFVLIQAYKFYELIFHENSSFAIKYIFVDLIFLWFLPILRIPWLTFSSSATLAQVAAMAVFNIFLGNNALTFTGILLGAWRGMFDKELSLSGAKVRSKDLYDTSSHLLGRYHVHILPESTAWLNPSKQSFCVGGEHSPDKVEIPVRLNATEPIFVQLNRIEFNTLEESSLNFTKKELKKMRMETSEDSLSYIRLPVKNPGLYRLGRVIDSSNMDVRLYATDVLVTSCPSAYIIGGDVNDKCVGETDAPKIVIDGVPPLKVKYGRSIRNQESLFSVQSVQPEGFVSPLLYGGLPQSGPIWRGEALEWAASSTVEVEMDTSLQTTGSWMYTIDEVEDALGNKINYSELTSRMMATKSLSYGFMVHTRPQIRFQNCDAEKPLKLAKGTKAQLPMSLSGTADNGPYTVEFEKTSLEGDDNKKFVETFKDDHKVTVSEPGVYKLKSIKGKYCEGDILESSQCIVYAPPEPTLQVDFNEITDICAGSVGIRAELSFTGTPPFKIRCKVLKDGQHIDTKTITVSQSRDTFEYKPHEAGEYSYEFIILEDDLYKNIQLNDMKYTQSIRALAGASFIQKNPHKKCCSSDSAEFDVQLVGEAPFTLEYEITHGSAKKTKFTKENLDGQFSIQTPPLKSGGRYTITLVSIKDANGCRTVLNEQDAVVEVRRQRPAAGFLPIDGSMSVKALEGRTVGLPLRLSGEGPWKVTYQYYDPQTEQTEEQTVDVRNPNGDKLKVNKRGRYSLSEVRDAYCPGEVTDTSSVFDVSWFEKPSMSIISRAITQKSDNLFVRNPVCEGDEDVSEVGLEGAQPFSIYYDVKGPASRADESVQVATKYANIKMLTQRSGTYKYTFNKFADGIYDAGDVKMIPFVVEQTVYARPSTGFVHKNRVYKACAYAEENDPQLEPIMIQFTGKPPFALTYNVKSESSGKSQQYTVQNIQEQQYALKSVYKGLNMGKHTVTLSKVQDSSCTREIYNDDSRVSIIVSDVPDLAQINHKQDYCVGERLAFGLSGIPPFQVVYDFNGKKQKAQTDTPFSRLASQPGNLTLLSLTDSASSCSKKLDFGPITIHPKPSVNVVDGARAYHDIHDGEQAELIFKFSGTPPFSFTYTRSDARGKVIETHSVPAVDSYQYSIFTSLQGVYEVVTLEDKYCAVASNK